MGFSGLQFDAYSPALRIPDLSGTGRRDFLRMLTSQDQALVGLRGDLGSKGFGPGADVDRLLSRLDDAMEAAVGLMAPLLCIDFGPLPAAPPTARPKTTITPEQAGLLFIPTPTSETPQDQAPPTPPDPAFVSSVDGALADLGQRADRYGVMLGFRSDLAGFASIDAALRRANCPYFGIDLDPPALLRDQWTADEIFSRLGHLIRHVRARDANVGSERRVQPTSLGRGDTNWPQLLSNLDAAGYAGWITIDPTELTDRVAAAAVGLAHLRMAMR